MRFVYRQDELKALNDMWRREGAQLLVLYGRRRVGKTTLVLHWSQRRRHAYWVAKRTSASRLLADFSQAVYRFRSCV